MSDEVLKILIGGLVACALAYMTERTKRAVEKKIEENTVVTADNNKKLIQAAEVSEVALKASNDVKRALVAAQANALAVSDQVKLSLQHAQTKTAKKLSAIQEIARKSHHLGLIAMLNQLKVNAALARKLATITKDAADIKKAEEAEKELADYIAVAESPLSVESSTTHNPIA